MRHRGSTHRETHALRGQTFAEKGGVKAPFADFVTQVKGAMTAFARRLDPGTHEFVYTADTLTPGDFLWPEATVEDRESPGVFGRTRANRVLIE